MEVKDSLSGIWSCVKDQTVAGLVYPHANSDLVRNDE
jgi:hypothetical protein